MAAFSDCIIVYFFKLLYLRSRTPSSGYHRLFCDCDEFPTNIHFLSFGLILYLLLYLCF